MESYTFRTNQKTITAIPVAMDFLLGLFNCAFLHIRNILLRERWSGVYILCTSAHGYKTNQSFIQNFRRQISWKFYEFLSGACQKVSAKSLLRVCKAVRTPCLSPDSFVPYNDETRKRYAELRRHVRHCEERSNPAPCMFPDCFVPRNDVLSYSSFSKSFYISISIILLYGFY
jgi:hypothetical protein